MVEGPINTDVIRSHYAANATIAHT
jgi:hypothetical protein